MSGMPTIDFSNNEVAVGLSTQQDGTIFEVSAPAGAIEMRGNSFRYRNDAARQTGGIYKLVAAHTHDGTYKVTVSSYGDVTRPGPDMVTHFRIGDGEWTVHGLWQQLGSRWKFIRAVS